MKKLIIFISMVALAQSCIFYSDRDLEEDPRQTAYEYLKREALGDLFRAVEIADFFDRYQAIKEDRDASTALGRLYFGSYLNESDLVYEGYEGGFWGTITPTGIPGSYQVIPMYADPTVISYNIEVTPERKFIIRSKPSSKALPPSFWVNYYGMELECTASISEGYIIIENLDMNYIETTGKMDTKAHITSTADPAMMHLCREGSFENEPFAGILNYKIENDIFQDEFSVKFHNGKYEIL